MSCVTDSTSLHIIGGEVEVIDDGAAGKCFEFRLHGLQGLLAQSLLAFAGLQLFSILPGDEH